MVCNNCGMQNNEGSKFCIGCGSSLETVQNNNINNIENNQIFNTQQNNMQMNSMSNQQFVSNGISSQQINDQIINQPANNVNKEKKPINKKLLFIIGGAVLAIIIVVVLLFLFVFKQDKVTKDLSSIFDLEQPIPVYKDGSYVYLDTKGKIIKNVKYNEASDFNGDYAYVELEDGTAALIDKNQNIKVKATSYYGMEYLSDYDLWLIDGVLYNGKLNQITDKSISLTYDEEGYFRYNNLDYTEYGIMNAKGKKIYKNKCRISSVDINHYNDEYYAVVDTKCSEEKNQFLIELETGKVLYENEYKKQYPDSYSYNLIGTSYNIFYIYNDSYEKIKYFYLKDNKIVYETTEDLSGLTVYGEKHLEIDYGYYYEELGKSQRYYYYNLDTKELETKEPKLEEKDIKIEKDVTKRQIVSCSNGKGLIDDKKVIIPCIYNNIEYLEDNIYEYMKQVKSMDLMFVEDDNEQLSIYDANKRKNIITFDNSEKSKIVDYENSLLIEQIIYVDDSWYSDLDKTIIHNLLTKEQIMFDKNSEIEIKSNYFIERKNGKKIYYNMDFEKIYTQN